MLIEAKEKSAHTAIYVPAPLIRPSDSPTGEKAFISIVSLVPAGKVNTPTTFSR